MYRVIIYNGTVSTIIHEASTDPAEPHLYSCTLTEGSPGEIDSLEFTILPNNPGYESLHTRTTMVEVLNTKTNTAEFTGRVLTMTPEMDSNGLIYKSVVCENQLGYLCDSIQPYTPEATYALEDFFKLLLNNHNSQVEDYKKIYPGYISVTTSTGNVTKGLNYETTWECIKSKLLDSVGGEVQLYTSNGLLYLDYVEELGSRKEQTIEIGKNMRSISQEIDPTEVITRLIPLGAKLEQSEDSEEEVDTEERTTIASVNNGVIYLDDEDAQAVYGIVAGVVEWEDVTEPSNLLAKAKQWLEDQSVTDRIVLSAVDLSLIGLEEDSIERYNYYRITNDAIGLDAYFRVTKRVVNICDPSDITYEMGSQSKSLSSTLTDASNTAARAATDAVAAINAELSKTVTALIVSNATIENLNAEVANITSLLAGNIGTGTLQSIHISSDNVVFDEAVINDAAIVSLTANKITSGTIYTDNVQIANNDGKNLWIDGSTIQISDGTYVRVQIGEDASGDYNLYLWGASGNLLWDALGLTEAGLTGNGAIIKDAAIADDANINESKIDMQSVAERLNEDGSISVDFTNVKVNDTTLDYALTTVTNNANAATAEAEAASAAAQTAQANATQAATDAATAQSTADAAAQAASDAQSVADTAKANATAAQTAADEAQATADAAAEAAANAQTYAEQVQRDAASSLSEYAESISTTIDGIQAQVDGQIETWYYDYAPTLKNLPASGWTTDDEKGSHIGDLFFDKSTGYSYRFFNNNGTYEWTLIQDTDITTALATASTAQDTADAKKRVFTSTPTPPYDVGDLWTDGTDIKTCMTARASGATYVSSDWVVLNEYANQDAVDAVQAAADAAQSAADSAQSAADTAASDAAAAQSTADTAKANAATAQTTANNAASAAADAQAAADEAQAAADAVTSRVTTLETDLTVVQGQISSKVWQTDITEAVSRISVGGRNYLRGTADFNGWVHGTYVTVEDDVATISRSGLTANAYTSIAQWIGDGYLSSIEGSTYVISFDIKSDDWASVQDATATYTGIAAVAAQIIQTTTTPFSTSYVQKNYTFMRLNNATYWTTYDMEEIDGEWIHMVSVPITIDDDFWRYSNIGTGDYIVFHLQLRMNGTIQVRHFKIEKGNTATDWTPAPEDTESLITTIQDQYTTVNQTVSGLVTQVGNIETTVSDNYESLSSQITTIEQTTSGITASVSSVQTQLSNLSVGGRNLILSSEENSVTRSNATNGWISEQVPFLKNSDYGIARLAEGGEFTLSFDYEITGITTACNVYLALEYTSSSYTKGNVDSLALSVGSNTGHYSCTFTPTEAQMEYGVAWLFTGFGAGNNADAVVTLRHVKLEIGSTATDWTPAPEDTEDALTEMNESNSETYATKTDVANEITKSVGTTDGISETEDAVQDLLLDENGDALTVYEALIKVASYLTLTSNSFNIEFETITGDLTALTDGTIADLQSDSAAYSTKLSYVNITDEPAIVLGASDSDFKVKITTTEIDFMEGDSKVAWISNQQLHITEAETSIVNVESKLSFWDTFTWTNINGALVLIKEGYEEDTSE